MRALAFVALAACSDDPCAGIEAACIAVHVSGDIEEIDQLELDVLYASEHSTTATSPGGGGTVSLPFSTTITLLVESDLEVGVVGAGKLAGNVLGTGAATTVVGPGNPTSIELVLAPPAVCVAGAYYCGGDKLAGDAQTLYECNGGGVPLARGRCTYGCEVRPTEDDVCLGGPMTCENGGFYCGGNELPGDPSTLYRCDAGSPAAPMECANGCVIAPAGSDDHCR